MPEGHDEEQDLDSLYRDVLFEHYRHPHNKGELVDAETTLVWDPPWAKEKMTEDGKLQANMLGFG